MKYQYRKQKGFSILAIILVIVAAIVAIGVWSLSGNINLSPASTSTLDIAISGLLADADNIKNTVDTTLIKKGADYKSQITYNTFTYDRPAINAKLIRSTLGNSEGKWTINPNNFFASGISGYNDNPDTTLLVGGITDVACKNINNKINGTTVMPVLTTYPSSNDAVSLISASVPGYTFNYIYLPSITQLAGWTRGCISVRNIPDNNIFFFVLIAN